jgi:hypothetical protein
MRKLDIVTARAFDQVRAGEGVMGAATVRATVRMPDLG